MKLSLLVLTIFSIVLAAQGQGCQNGADCLSSVDCAVSGGGTGCRCSWLTCMDLGEETCGGGCLTDAQCQQWSGGDTTCTCSWLLECERASAQQEPGYEAYAKLMMAIKKDKIQKRLAVMTKKYKEQENLLDERLRNH